MAFTNDLKRCESPIFQQFCRCRTKSVEDQYYPAFDGIGMLRRVKTDL